MTLTPLLMADVAVQIHAITAIAAFVLGPFVILRRRRDRIHKLGGYLWVVLMLATATSAIFVNDIRLVGPFSPIHIFVPVTYFGIYTGLRHIFAGRVVAHRQAMAQLYGFALAGAGLFTFLPGRIMSEMVFPNAPTAGFIALCLIAAGLLWRSRAVVFPSLAKRA